MKFEKETRFIFLTLTKYWELKFLPKDLMLIAN